MIVLGSEGVPMPIQLPASSIVTDFELHTTETLERARLLQRSLLETIA
ncbi:hypothetical protein ACFLIM_34955 [Nonomuraea sp. M3C6]|uniref:Uncharacterized protein n=1 Tax=Nonomuraea marmarensis TaxID=3351344 RepID=A0ABW7APR8_9ACTN